MSPGRQPRVEWKTNPSRVAATGVATQPLQGVSGIADAQHAATTELVGSGYGVHVALPVHGEVLNSIVLSGLAVCPFASVTSVKLAPVA